MEQICYLECILHIVNTPSVEADAGDLRVTLDAASRGGSATPCGEGVSSHPTSGNSTKLESPQMKASTNEIFVPINELLTKRETLQRQAICNLLMKAGEKIVCSCKKNTALRTHARVHTCMQRVCLSDHIFRERSGVTLMPSKLV